MEYKPFSPEPGADGFEYHSRTQVHVEPRPIEFHPLEFDQEKLLGHGGGEKPLLEKSLFRSLLSLSWLIHVIALGCTAAAVQLTFNNTYWTDEADWEDRFLWSILRGTRVEDCLQFAAKLYEIIVVMSLSAMVMHALRRMLVGDGVAWGLLSGAYQVGAPTYLFSRQLWAPFCKPGSKSNFSMALVLAVLVIYANMIGPFTAIIISPILEWWPLHDPYDGQKLTSFIYAPDEFLYPATLNTSYFAPPAEDQDEACLTYAEPNCPDSGFPDIKSLMDAWAQSNAKPSVQIKHAGAETSRELVSTLQYSTEKEALAVATTLHSSITELAGAFWNYIDSNETDFKVSQSKRPRFTPDRKDLFAPIVQVQCNHYSYNELKEKDDDPSFHMGRMRNLSSYHNGVDDSYKGRDPWRVRREIWDTDDGSTSLHWVDVGDLDDHPSIGVFVTVPMARFSPTNKTAPTQDWLLLPCMIDASWIHSTTSYDPSKDNLLPNSLADLSKLAPYWDGKGKRKLDAKPNMLISTGWAKRLDLQTGEVTSWAGRTFNGSAMNWLLQSFMFDHDVDGQILTSFKTANFTEMGPKADDEAARGVATTLSLAFADAVSRVALTWNIGVLTDEFQNNTVGWKQLWLQSSQDAQGESTMSNEEWEKETYRINWKVDRKGWGYGFKTPTIIIGVGLLLAHSVLVVFFCIYVLWFRLTSNGWASGAWGGLSELVALALASRRPNNHQLIRNLAEGNEKWETNTTRVFVRTLDHEGVELILGDANHGNRLTIGRAYST